MQISARYPHRVLSLVRMVHPVPMILVVPVDPTRRLPPALPLLGLVECRCQACLSANVVRWIRVGPLFLRRLLIPGPEQESALDGLVRRCPWLTPVGPRTPDHSAAVRSR